MSMFIDYAKFKEFIMSRTNEMAAAMGYDGKTSPGWEKLTPTGKATVKYLTEHTVDGFYKQVAELMDILTKENISGMLKRGIGDFPGAALVPLNRKNGICYREGEAFVVTDGKRGVMNDGQIGNDFNTKKEDNRPATEKEIDEFLEKIKSYKKIGSLLAYF